MAKHVDDRDDGWGESVARHTFVWTVVGAALFAGAVFLFIL
jgi:hypothetical protein